MGLSYGNEYTWTDHFKQRAKERFSIEADGLKKWLNRQIHTLTFLDDGDCENRKRYISDEGIIFVCDIQKRQFVTCYAVNSGTLKNHISEQQLLHYQQFLDEKEQLIRRYHMQYVKLTLAELIPEIEVFLHYANKLANSKRYLKKNNEWFQQVNARFLVIQEAMHSLNITQKNYRK